MNKTISVIIAVVVVAGVGWFLYNRPANTLPPTPESETDSWTLSASMACEDGFNFIAEFPEEDQVRILVNGNVFRTLPRVAGAGQRFEDDMYAFVFAGEEASLTIKADGRNVICRQPLDPNNAPVNFGDAGEGGGVKPDLVLVVSENIQGRWQSIEDPKFIREFRAGGTMIEEYEGKQMAEAKWQIFTSEKPPKVAVSFPLEASATYLQIAEMGAEKLTLDFKITKVTPEELDIIYMGRGGGMSFRRVP